MSEKMLSRQVKFGAEWISDPELPLKVDGIPKSLGGELEDDEGLKWIKEYFDRKTGRCMSF